MIAEKIILGTFFLFLVISFSPSISSGQTSDNWNNCYSSSDNYYKYYNGEKEPLFISTNEIRVFFDDSANIEEIEKTLGEYGAYKPILFESSGVFQYKQCFGEEGIKFIVDSLNELDIVNSANNVFYSNSSNGFSLFVIGDNFIAKILGDKQELYNLNKKYGVNILEENWANMENVFKLEVNRKLGKDSLELVNIYYESGLFEYVESDALISGGGGSASSIILDNSVNFFEDNKTKEKNIEIAEDLKNQNHSDTEFLDQKEEKSNYIYWITGAIILLILLILLFFISKKSENSIPS